MARYPLLSTFTFRGEAQIDPDEQEFFTGENRGNGDTGGRPSEFNAKAQSREDAREGPKGRKGRTGTKKIQVGGPCTD